MFDVIFMSNDECNADSNFKLLKQHVPWAQRISGASSIHQAHHWAADVSRTHWFFSVDGDNRITNFQVFFGDPPWSKSWHYKAVGVFRATNPTNALVYGWGGVKLWNKTLLKQAPEKYQDFTTAFPMYVIDCVASEHCYNTTSWDTWRTVFREVFKLKQKNDEKSQTLLDGWQQPYDDFAFRTEYLHALNLTNSIDSCFNVNCWKTLRELYDRTFEK